MSSFIYQPGRLLKFSGTRYFAREAEQMSIGDYGRKNTPFGQAPYLSPDGNYTIPKVDVSGIFHLTEARARQLAGSHAVQASIPIDDDTGFEIDTSMSSSSSSTRDVTMSLLVISTDFGDVRNVINGQSAGTRNSIRRNSRWRIIDTVVVAVAGNVSETRSTNVSISAGASGTFTVGGLAIEAASQDGGSVATQSMVTVELAPDSTAGYRFAKPSRWNRSGRRRNRTYTLASLVDDNKGLG